ncbi:MAG: response regulator [bacterium]|nr:response regulator [bacterium]
MDMTPILVVDDQSAMRRIIKNQLKSAGYGSVDEAGSGAAALARLAEVHYALVILDWTMPGMTGIEVLEEIRRRPELQRIKVVMVTAEGLRENVLKAVQAGANNYVVKPFSPAALIERINETLGG